MYLQSYLACLDQHTIVFYINVPMGKLNKPCDSIFGKQMSKN